MKPAHEKAAIGEMTTLKVRRPMNHFCCSIPKGRVYLITRLGYKLVVVEDLQVKISSCWSKYVKIPVLKVKH